MKVLLTGATGFVGHHVLNALRTRYDLDVTCVVRNDGHTLRDVETIVWDVKASPVKGLYDRFGRPDLVIHLAWGVLDNFKNPLHVTDEFPAHDAFLQALVDHGLPRLTVTGTCLEYGLQSGALREDMDARPVTDYAIAKHKLYQSLAKEIDVTWLRLFYMYGDGQSPKSLIPSLDAAIARGDAAFNMSGGEQLRDYLPVETLAGYIVACALQSDVTGVINIGSGKPVRIRDFVGEHLRKRNASIALNLGHYPYPDYEPMEFWADTTKLQRALSAFGQ